jgi:aspartate/methionine/tyrosine aminotransferase
MRRDIVHVGSGQLTYEIREIVEVANKLSEMGVEIIWENIGDPMAKGEKLPQWIKDVITELVNEDIFYGYVATAGVPETRRFLADRVNQRGGYQVSPEDILFFNGLGDAVSKIFGFLKREARVLGPSPAYSTHSSAEAAHSGYEHLTYTLDPDNRWMPDLDEMEKKVKYNDSIAGILIINPDNPTGAVYPREYLETIVDIARKYDLFIIADEIYANIVYNPEETCQLCDVIGEVPGISMRGISKEYPWPGARCGWIEVYNQDIRPTFAKYIKTIRDAKMLEVCSTSLPQYSIPKIMGDDRYKSHIENRAKMFEQRADEAYKILSSFEGIKVQPARGAFYMTVLFEDDVLNDKQSLGIKNPQAKDFIEKIVRGVEVDKRFVYYLLGGKGICVVPLTGFCCERKGFRITLLETDDEKRKATWISIGEAVKEYLASA